MGPILPAIYGIAVAVLVAGTWVASLSLGRVPELRTKPWEIRLHTRATLARDAASTPAWSARHDRHTISASSCGGLRRPDEPLSHLLEFRGSSYRFRQSLVAREGRPDGALATPSPD